MKPLSNARVSALSPLSLGIIVAGLLMFVVIAIVRSVTTQPSDIGATTAASLTSIPWEHVPLSNNVSDALPAFNAQAPAVVGVYDNQVAGVTLLEPVDLSWATEIWLAIATTADGSRWVYGDAWFSCRHIDQAALTYWASPADPALAVWNELAPRKQSEIAKECGL